MNDLRKRVARAICCAVGTYQCETEEPVCEVCLLEADAAIAIVRNETLEEAARECDLRIELLHGQLEVVDITRECDAYRIAAAAIRALKDKT